MEGHTWVFLDIARVLLSDVWLGGMYMCCVLFVSCAHVREDEAECEVGVLLEASGGL